MSFDGQVLCQRIEVTPCALTILGKPSTAAPPAATAALRTLRRDTFFALCSSACFWSLMVRLLVKVTLVKCDFSRLYTVQEFPSMSISSRKIGSCRAVVG